MKMKKIISDKILRDKMSLAVDTLCNTVKTTLGPKGSNVIIDHSSFTPFLYASITFNLSKILLILSGSLV